MTTPQTAGTTPFFGGLKLQWYEEGVEPAESEPATKQLAMVPNYLGALVLAYNAWLADAARGTVEAWLLALFGEAVAWYEEYGFLQGKGAGQPLGILNSGATINVSRAVAGDIEFADIGGMLNKLLPESINRCFWMYSPTCQSALMQLKDGANRAVMLQVGATPAGRGQWTIAGIPAYPTEKLPALGTKGDLVLIDPRWYAISDFIAEEGQPAGGGRSLAVSFSGEASQTVFTKNQTVFMISQRLDARPVIDSPITLQDGVTQVSPFVALN